MQLFSVSPQPSSTVRPAPQQDHEPTEPKGCGWYDSSFELASGLEISEQDDDLLYQLCEFCLH
jgi:hypothetical protein